MTRPDALRRALHAAVDAFFDALAGAPANDSPRPRRTVVRPVPTPDAEPTDLDRELARRELARKGITR